MTIDFKDFVDEVKRRSPLPDIMDDTGEEWRVTRRWHGEYMRCAAHDSLVVNVNENLYTWNSRSERGDVFNWLENRNQMDFMTALQYLAKRAGMEMPRFERDQSDTAAKEHSRSTVWAAVADELHAMLLGSHDVLRYCTDVWSYKAGDDGTPPPMPAFQPRAWDMNALERARIGFNGGNDPAAYQRMRDVISKYVDLSHPDAVTIIGYKGDVSAWGKQYGINPPENWLQNGYIPGLMGRKRLIFPHFEGGQCVYFTARNILGGEVMADGKVLKSFNPPEAVAGVRRMYKNWLVRSNTDEIVFVEGQGDAVSMGCMGVAAVALCGLSPERYMEEIDRLKYKRGGANGEKPNTSCRTLYLGVDADNAGMQALVGTRMDWPYAKMFGPLSWVLRWNTHPDETLRQWDAGVKVCDDVKQAVLPASETALTAVKDANDLLRALRQALDMQIRFKNEAGDLVKKDSQTGEGCGEGTPETLKLAEVALPRLRPMLEGADMQIVCMARWAAEKNGPERQRAESTIFEYLLEMGEGDIKKVDRDIKKILHRSDLKSVLDALRKERSRSGSSAADSEPIEIVSDAIDDHLIETLYDHDLGITRLAVRYPDGRVEAVDNIAIGGRRYIPISAMNRLLTDNIVLFPSEVQPVKQTREIAAVIRQFIHRYVDIDPFYERLASFYVIFSWLYDCFPQLCYLRALGDYGTGKTRFITTIGAVCYKPIYTAGATSVSSIFRLLDIFRGTLVLDEADFSNSDETAAIIKILNVGNDSRLGNVLRTEDQGNGKYMPVPYRVYGPKVIATRKKFGDAATESRCLTKEMGGAVVRDDIKKVLQDEFWRAANEIRNMLLAYRMKWWAPTIQINYDEAQPDVEPRLIQVTLPLKTIIGRDEPDLIDDLDGFIKRYNNQLRAERSMSIESKVVEAIIQLGNDARRATGKGAIGPEGLPKIFLKAVATRTNRLIDDENDDDDEDNGSGSNASGKMFRKKLTSKSIGHYLRAKLQCSVDRDRDGFYLVWDENRIQALCLRFGVEDAGRSLIAPPTAAQPGLV